MFVDQSKDTSFPLTFSDEVADAVRAAYGDAAAVLEYGSGGSTLLAASLGVPCLAVESDPDWAAALEKTLTDRFGPSPSASVVHVDIGPTKEWGFPKDRRASARFWQYPMLVWDDDFTRSVDTVLIDGRMRTACFAAVLTQITRPVRVLFDDYANRPHYHVVQDFVTPQRLVGRMAVFDLTPGMIDISAFRSILPWFSHLR